MSVRAMEIRLSIPEIGARSREIDLFSRKIRRFGSAASSLGRMVPRLPSASRVDRLTASFEKQVKPLEQIDALYKSIAESGKALAQVPQLRAAKASGGGSGGSSRASSGFMQGPYQRLERIREQMERARTEGDEAALKDLRILEFRAKRSAILGERRLKQGDPALEGPGLLDLFQELNSLMNSFKSGNVIGGAKQLTRTLEVLKEVDRPGGLNIIQKLARPGIGGAPAVPTGKLSDFILPGVGTAAKTGGKGIAGKLGAGASALSRMAMGAGPALIPLAAAATLALATWGAVRALQAMSDTAAAAGRIFKGFGDARTISGGGMGTISRLSAYGLDPGSIPGAARAFRERLASDPSAMGTAASRLGIPQVLPRQYQYLDETKLFSDALESLARRPERERREIAQRLDLEEFLPALEMMSKYGSQMRKDADALGRIMTDNTGAFKELERSELRLQQSRSARDTAIGAGWAKMATWWNNLRADANFKRADFNNWFARWANKPGSDTRSHEQALRENTAALRRSTEQMERLEKGTYGGGDRARNAIPGKWGGWAASQGVPGEVLNLGGFSL